ncbi:MAG: methyltransferase domain-containing protein [Chloroflexi bacterium]|nr:MAG: methyltransferase domain-containing protein [Chloroflexota bacterium]
MKNPWIDPDRLPPEEALSLAQFINGRSDIPDQRQAHSTLVDALSPQSGARLLDFGCGTGVIARRLAPLVGETGEVVGADISRVMLDFARSCGGPAHLRYEQSDGAPLPFPDDSFDGAAMARTLMHVDNPHETLVELRRVVRPGGRLAILECDWGTVALDHSDRALTRRILDWRTDTVDGNNWMGRQVVARCLAAGWASADAHVLVTVGRDATTTHFGSIRRAGDLARQNGVITQSEYDSWVGELDSRLTAGLFFASINEYIVVVRRGEDG